MQFYKDRYQWASRSTKQGGCQLPDDLIRKPRKGVRKSLNYIHFLCNVDNYCAQSFSPILFHERLSPMLTWWTNMESLAALNTWMLAATMVFAVLTGIMVFLTIGKSKRLIDQFSEDAQNYRKQVKSLEKTAEGIRKELLQTQQHQDINQLKLKTSNSSAQELRQSLLDARKRLEIAEAAIKTHEAQTAENEDGTDSTGP
jgi:hypothetical protein